MQVVGMNIKEYDNGFVRLKQTVRCVYLLYLWSDLKISYGFQFEAGV